MRQVLPILLFFCLFKVQAQVVISGTTGKVDAQITFDFQTTQDISIDPSGGANGPFDFTSSKVTFLGSANPNIKIVGSKPLELKSLTLNATGNYSLNQGELTVSENLDLTGGVLTVSPNSKLLYSGLNNLSSAGASYINGLLFMKGSGQRTFPIGNALGGYLPVTLSDVKSGDGNTEIGFEAIAGDPGIPSNLLSADIKEVFGTNYWLMTNGNSGTYSGSVIQLSLNSAGTFFLDGDPVILELDTDGKLNNLNGISVSPDVVSQSETTSKGQKYAFGKSESVAINIHRVITPNSDGQNDFLYIDGIDFYTSNSVKLVDRWGVVHFSKENFKNYSLQNPADFDFSKLSGGNYICVVDLGSGVKVKPKMISVIK